MFLKYDSSSHSQLTQHIDKTTHVTIHLLHPNGLILNQFK